MSNRIRKLGLLTASITTIYLLDKYAYYSTLERNLRTLFVGGAIALDYKLNFNPQNAQHISDLHARVCDRVLKLCRENGGLYIKFGQQMAAVPVLPPQYLPLRQLYDNAPYIPYEEVKEVFVKDFGITPDEVYTDFERVPIASASIAQVHKAKLPNGQNVAVKIQKPSIGKQIFWDMMAYRAVLLAFERLFDLDLYWSAGIKYLT